MIQKIAEQSLTDATAREVMDASNVHYQLDDQMRMLMKDLSIDQKKECIKMIQAKVSSYL